MNDELQNYSINNSFREIQSQKNPACFHIPGFKYYLLNITSLIFYHPFS